MRGRLPVVGTYTGTGAALTVSLDFQPKCVIAYNETDGICLWLFIEGMAAGKGLKVVDSGVGTTDLSFVASNGITQNTRGFKVGTDADMNTNAKVYRFIAF